MEWWFVDNDVLLVTLEDEDVPVTKSLLYLLVQFCLKALFSIKKKKKISYLSLSNKYLKKEKIHNNSKPLMFD